MSVSRCKVSLGHLSEIKKVTKKTKKQKMCDGDTVKKDTLAHTIDVHLNCENRIDHHVIVFEDENENNQEVLHFSTENVANIRGFDLTPAYANPPLVVRNHAGIVKRPLIICPRLSEIIIISDFLDKAACRLISFGLLSKI